MHFTNLRQNVTDFYYLKIEGVDNDTSIIADSAQNICRRQSRDASMLGDPDGFSDDNGWQDKDYVVGL